MLKTAQDIWYGYRAKLNIKYELPFYLYCYKKMSDRGAAFESGNWNPVGGTGYPYSGQQFVYVRANQDQGNSIQSGTANVPASEDCSPANSSIYVFVSGTVNPYQSSSWYQWQSGVALVAGTPLNQSTSNGGTFASGSSLYRAIPNQNMDPVRNSGVANVRQSESSWNV